MNEIFISTNDLSTIQSFFIALLLGALIGVEREHQANENEKKFGGLRTFTLCALFGALTAWMDGSGGTPIMITAGLICTIAVLGIAIYIDGIHIKHVPGLTSEFAAAITYLLGAGVMRGHAGIAVMLAIAMLSLLAFKRSLHRIIRLIGRDDLIAGLKLLVATFIVLPLLPNQTIDRWGALNPFKLWWLVILISTLSLIGYVSVRLMGTRRGTALTGFFGGLVSSTAVTLSFARRSKEESGLDSILALGILLAWSIMFVRVVIEVAVVKAELLVDLAPPLMAMFIASVIALIWFLKRSRGKAIHETSGESSDQSKDITFKNPFSLTSAIQFGLLFAAVLLVVKIFQLHTPENWLYMIAALAGTTDVDAITLSLAETANSESSKKIAVLGILIASWSNTIVKCGLVLFLGSRSLGIQLLIASLLIVAMGGIAYMLS